MNMALGYIQGSLAVAGLGDANLSVTYREQSDGFAIDLIDQHNRMWTCEFVAVGVGRGRKCTP